MEKIVQGNYSLTDSNYLRTGLIKILISPQTVTVIDHLCFASVTDGRDKNNKRLARIRIEGHIF